MSVHLTPSNTLGFNRPLTVLVKRTLTISNPNALPVAFKVKTTAPKLYCVRPNSGRVEPGESVEVAVMLQALREEPPMNAKCKDKFLIQSTLLTPEKEAMSGQDIWSPPESASDEQKVYQQKLKVAYLPPEGHILEEEEENQLNQSSMLTTNQSQQYDTVRQHPLTNGDAPIPSAFTQPQEAPRAHTPPADFSFAREESHEPPVDDKPPPVSVIVEPPTEPAAPIEQERSLSPSPPTYEMQNRLEEAQAEIERLRALLAGAEPPQEVRRRKSHAYDDDATTIPGSDVGTIIEEQPVYQEGVPLQVVVIIALGVFITTYLFF